MHQSSSSQPVAPSFSTTTATDSVSCPYSTTSPPPNTPSSSTLSRLNPLNYMPTSISQSASPHQSTPLPTARTTSSIPKSNPSEKWEYPSPQQMYNALVRKTPASPPDITAIESMVSIHNFLNEGAWAEIVEWERRFAGGLARGFRECRRGEAGSRAAGDVHADDPPQPRLARFMGRPADMTPKARMWQAAGRVAPGWFEGEAPFDRHDWFVHRPVVAASGAGEETREVRYVIDYYAAPEDDEGEPVFYLDVRPAVDSPTAAAERVLRWGGDVWWRATGGDEVVRERREKRDEKERERRRG